MNKRHIIYSALGALGFVGAAQLVHFFKINMVVGSYTAFFSLNNCLLPLSGAFFGLEGAMLVTLLKMLVAGMLGGTLFSLHYLAFYIPGFFAAAYWASPSILMRVLVPIVCMIAFIAHPIGGVAWLYTIYWLIPVLLYFFWKNGTFFTALGSTFVAHAVGSVIWIYTVPMAAHAWLALIPVVIIERLLFAMGMTAFYFLYEQACTVVVLPIIARMRRLA